MSDIIDNMKNKLRIIRSIEDDINTDDPLQKAILASVALKAVEVEGMLHQLDAQLAAALARAGRAEKERDEWKRKAEAYRHDTLVDVNDAHKSLKPEYFSKWLDSEVAEAEAQDAPAGYSSHEERDQDLEDTFMGRE